MAYRAILGGSPLGLIGVRSTVPSGAPSSFNAGKTRNIENVDDYNNKMGINHPGSLFTGKRSIRAWPEIKSIPEQNIGDTKIPSGWDTAGTQDVQYGVSDTSSRKTLHNDTTYDTSILNIIEQLSNTKAQLKPADFAYLKNVGVYPNNRLMIARRFASPVDDNIMVKKKNTELSALAVLISWLPENQNYLEISFGETWDDAQDADFSSILSSLGADVMLKAGGPLDLGSILGSGAGIVPLPGFTEIFQRQFLAKIGLIEESAKNIIPAGNPNLIKMAKQRRTVGYGQVGSGLTCNVSIKMNCEYELKFISGVDPTIVWMDLLGMILRFGTSNSESYGLSKNASSKVINWVNNPNILIDDVVKGLKSSLGEIITQVTDQINGFVSSSSGSSGSAGINISLDSITNQISGIANSITSGLMQKYRVRILGVINALSGLPSTPWHITIGNPLRPVFCSGDMVTTNVSLKLGPILAFNDLPSSITVEFDLSNARPWGLQEIMAKFNSGYLRSVDTQKTFYETKSYDKGGNTYIESVGKMPFDSQNGSILGSSGTSGVGGTSIGTINNVNENSGSVAQVGVSNTGNVINSPSGSFGKNYIEGGKNQNAGKTNSDPNSIDVIVDNGKK